MMNEYNPPYKPEIEYKKENGEYYMWDPYEPTDGGWVLLGCETEDPEEFIAVYVLGFCGCVEYEDIVFTVYHYLRGLKFEEPWDNIVASTSKLESYLIAHICEQAELSEHGTSIRGSWLTPLGEWVYEELKEYYTDYHDMRDINGEKEYDMLKKFKKDEDTIDGDPNLHWDAHGNL